MIATHFFQQVNQWFVPFVRHSQTTAESAAPAQPAASEQVIVQPGDSYFFDAGAYRLRVLTGDLWLPEHGILRAGAQLALCVEEGGVESRPATAYPVVFIVCPNTER